MGAFGEFSDPHETLLVFVLINTDCNRFSLSLLSSQRDLTPQHDLVCEPTCCVCVCGLIINSCTAPRIHEGFNALIPFETPRTLYHTGKFNTAQPKVESTLSTRREM